MKLYIDPAFHETQYSEALVGGPEGILYARHKGTDLVATAKWIVLLKQHHPDAEIEIDTVGPGKIIKQYIEGHLGVVL